MISDRTILGGAKRKRTRARGFIADWSPRDQTHVLLDQVQAVLDEYADHLPLTNRQIFYRLVGAHGYSKTQQAYDNLCEMLQKARRSGMIRFAAIRDDGGQYNIGALGYDDADDFMDRLRRRVEHFRLDRQQGQAPKIVLACEAEGMVPQLERVAADHGVPVISGGGFDSVTAKHNLAEDLAADDRPVTVLHIGDHDPSGAHLFLAFAEDVQAFMRELGGEVEFHRLAVTPEQSVLSACRQYR